MGRLSERGSSATDPDRSGWYLYALMRGESGLDVARLAGLPNGSGSPRPVEVVANESVAAVASPVSEKRIRPQRANLAAHHGVLRALMESGAPFLPACFGVVAPSRRALRELLKTNRKEIEGELKRLAGMVEMGLKVTWEVDNIFSYFVTQYSELAELRDRTMRKAGGASRDDMIELGQEFESLLKHVRAKHTTTLKRGLGSCVVELKEEAPPAEKVVLKAACLIRRSDEKRFEEALLQAASQFDDHYSFDYNGPWPPFNFVEISLKDAILQPQD